MTGERRSSGAPGPLLETKLYVPRRARDLVARTRLTDRLDRGSAGALLLVSAPAGFGKTTMLAQWLSGRPERRPVAWLSLDRGDNDPITFWTYVVAALRSVSPEVGATASVLLQQGAPVQTVLTTLLNDLVAQPDDLLLVLDDYHLVESREVHDALAFLLDHLPDRLHLVIAGRADPPLPLARLRARGLLTEVRASDLRFTAEEAVAYLGGTMGLHLSDEDAAALESRTEGWIAALQLAALSLQGRDDVSAFVAGFAGDDRYVVDYLVEEVLQRQPETVRSFLVQTSLLERLSGALCDAITEGSDGAAVLESLDRANLFLFPLDDRREWYRYHRLFADVLQARLLAEQPALVPELHGRASTWFEQHGYLAEAVAHAQSGDDPARAAALVELAVPAMRRQRQEATALGWMTALPDAILRDRPVLSVHLAGARLSTGHLDGVEERLRDAERWLQPGADTRGMVVVDQDELAALPSIIALYRAAGALAVGDVEAALVHAGRVLEVAADDLHLVRGAAAGLLALAFWGRGDLVASHRMWAQSSASLFRAGHVADTFGCAVALADIRLAQGRLRDARSTYERALEVTAGPVLRGTVDMYIGLGEVLREQGDLEAAEQHLTRSRELGDHLGLPQAPYRRQVAAARLRESRGDLAGALALLDEAQRLYVPDFFPDVRPIASARARVQVRQGDLGAALAWARDRGLSPEDDLSYLREHEHLTLARALLADPATTEQGLHLLDRLLAAAEAGERGGSVLEILVQQALALDLEAALAPLGRALALAEPEEQVRTFVDEGRPMAALLARAAEQGIAPTYARRLLAAFEPTQPVAAVRRHVRRARRLRHARRVRGVRSRRTAQPARAGRPAPPAQRPDRPADRPRARRLAAHRAQPHQEHLRQARRQQPARSGPPRRGARPAGRFAHPALTAAPHGSVHHPSSPHVVIRGHHIGS